MATFTLNEIQLIVDDLSHSALFYRDVLGLSPADGGRMQLHHGACDFRASRGVLLKLLERTGKEQCQMPGPSDRSAPFHLCLKVRKMAPVVERLRKASVRFALEPKDGRGNVRVCFFYDPDGILLELTEGDITYDRTFNEQSVMHADDSGIYGPTRVDHIAVEVANRASVAGLADELLGLKPIGELNFPDLGFDVTYLSDGRLGCELFDFGESSAADHFEVDQRWRIRLAALPLQGDSAPHPVAILFGYNEGIKVSGCA